MGTRPDPHLDADGLRLPRLEAANTSDKAAHDTAPRARLHLEPGCDATEALLRVMDDPLLRVMLRTSFRPIGDLDMVPVAPCPHCLDGALRVAGTVRERGERGEREIVRACDTCAAVLVGDRQLDPGPTPTPTSAL